jgi:hypothetical protein
MGAGAGPSSARRSRLGPRSATDNSRHRGDNARPVTLVGLVAELLVYLDYSFEMPSDADEDLAERAVRDYLIFLDDPRKLIDEAHIDSLQAKAQHASDPIERLHIYAELERAQSADESTYRRDFVRHAKSWAVANDVCAAAFGQMGVDDAVLRSAGLLPEVARGRANPRRSVPAPQRTTVTAEAIKHHVRSLRGTFTLLDIRSQVGGSPMTVRKGVQALVDDGTIGRLGPMPGWVGRGRSPIVFEVL